MISGHVVFRRQIYSASCVIRAFRHPARRTVSTLNPDKKWRGFKGSLTGKDQGLPDNPCRTRFAPSPTGYLHLGSLRTALYNYLLAKTTNGQFILRIEDTDQKRLVADAEQRLYDDLKWAGLTWDEGPDVGGPYGPYKQSERLPIYDEHCERLIRDGRAYRCFCSPEDLQAQRVGDYEKQPPNPCIHITPEESAERASKGEGYAVIFKPDDEPPMFQDFVYGAFRSRLAESDFFIRKRDGFPTYHFANVVDDHLMKITHVIRGAEWLISTPKHLQLYKALGWEPPAFGHVGLLVDEKKHKLSKRAPGVDLSWYKHEKILPAALLNFAILLGWSPNSKNEVMTLQEMVQKFRLRFTKGDIVVQVPGKLPFFDFMHKHALLREEPPNMPLIQRLFVDPVEKGINEFLATQQASSDAASATSGESGPRMHPRAAAAYSAETGRIVDPEFFLDLVRQLADYGLNMGNVAQKTRHLIWEIPNYYLFENLRNAMTTSRAEGSAPGAPFVIETAAILDLARRRLEHVGPESWTADRLREVLKGEVEPGVSAALALEGVRDPEPRNSQDQPPVRSIHTPLRRALLGNDSGPKNVDVMVFLGREESLKRLKTAAEMARKLAYQPDWEPEKGFTWKKMEPPSGTRSRAPPPLGPDILDEGGETRSKKLVIRRILK